MESVVVVELLLWLAIIDDVAAAPPPTPALPTLPKVVGRGTTPAEVGTTGASPSTDEPAFETVTAAVAAVGDERGRLQMLLTVDGPVPVDNVVFVEADVKAEIEDAVAVAADDRDEIVEKLFAILRAFVVQLVPVCVVLVDNFVAAVVDNFDAQWSGNSQGPSLQHFFL